MIITSEGTTQHLGVEEHLQRKNIVYQDPHHTILLTSDKKQPFAITQGEGDYLYIDLFALHFGLKEQLHRRTSKGLVPLHYGCERAERDRLLYLPVDQIVEQRASHTCCEGCQYYSPPVGVKSRYRLHCILARYRAFEVLDFKTGLTLEEVGRIYGCTRERIRQIEEKAMQKMRHVSRLKRLKIFYERVADHRDYYVSAIEDSA
jgi:hypothetical protein